MDPILRAQHDFKLHPAGFLACGSGEDMGMAGVVPCLSPHCHGSGGFFDDKYSLIVGLLVGGEKEKALSLRIISISHAVHDFSVKKVHAYLWTIVIECEVLHREDLMGRMALISHKGFDEENRFEETSGHLDDLLVIFHFGNVEDLFRWHEIRRVALDDLAVSKMNNHLMLCHERSSLSQPLIFGFSSVYSVPCWYSLNRKKPLRWHQSKKITRRCAEG
jgi:hypothetical protein